MSVMSQLISLFFVAFFSASILPMQSEALLVLMQQGGHIHVLVLLVVASVGNILGSCLNWWMGWGLASQQYKRWFPIRPSDLERGEIWFARYGNWALLLSWVPIIGDPITLVAGVLRMPFLPFLALVAIAKTARYVVLLLIFA